MLRCPQCRHRHTHVVDIYQLMHIRQARRRRECQRCGHRFTTRETIVGETSATPLIESEIESVLANLHPRVTGTPAQYQELRDLLDAFFSAHFSLRV